MTFVVVFHGSNRECKRGLTRVNSSRISVLKQQTRVKSAVGEAICQDSIGYFTSVPQFKTLAGIFPVRNTAHHAQKKVINRLRLEEKRSQKPIHGVESPESK